MNNAPLRAIVLDNDEATGSYMLLFSLWETLQKTSIGEALTFRQVLEFLIENVEKYNIFRPGLFKLLDTAYELREAGKIDALIMYTHQNADFTWKDWSIPALLATLMGHLLAKKKGHLLSRVLFDHVLSLPPEDNQKELPGGWVTKSFDRILNLYPWKPQDIRGIIFMDDHASPKYIDADSVPEGFKDASSWYKVFPYRVSYGATVYKRFIGEFVSHFNLVMEGEDEENIRIIATSATEEKNGVATYRENDRSLIDLEGYIRERYNVNIKDNRRK